MRRLTPAELDAYDVIDRSLAERVRIVPVPFLAPGASGMTIGRFIFLTSDPDQLGGRELLAHELVHVRQFAELGFLRFLFHYLRDYGRCLRELRKHRAAYLAIPAEERARAEAAVWQARRKDIAAPG
ncbi:MAG: hypothetical protein ACI9C1_002011 [Candidatus Aldehydirespiratoraceae bacterium]|jgi:hypothetical protein